MFKKAVRCCLLFLDIVSGLLLCLNTVQKKVTHVKLQMALIKHQNDYFSYRATVRSRVADGGRMCKRVKFAAQIQMDVLLAIFGLAQEQ